MPGDFLPSPDPYIYPSQEQAMDGGENDLD